MPRSAIREIMALAADRKDVIHLEVGEPDFSTPAHVIEAAFAAARAGWTKYSPNAGLPALRRRVAERTSRAWRREVSAERIVITTGAIGALYSALMSVIDPGDEVLIPDPGWPNYEAIVRLADATPVRFAQPAARGSLPDPGEIARLVTPKTKALLINTPGNPTGAVFPSALMADISQIVRASGIYLISDEIYEDLVFEGKHASAAEFTPADRLLEDLCHDRLACGLAGLSRRPRSDRHRAAGAGDELRLDHRAEGGRDGACGRPAMRQRFPQRVQASA
jgi:aspartate aminotransferase/aminotransferase